MLKNTRDHEQIAHFAQDSDRWWDPQGPFKPLHRLNPARMKFLRDSAVRHFRLDDERIAVLKGLSVLDIGCGGGLVAEPMARMGASVTGVDADANGIAAARFHADAEAVQIEYICGAAEDLAARSFDIVLALEVIEHVSSPEDFVSHCAALAAPGGLVVFSTLNRNWKSFSMGIVAAEYLLGWVPKGTHDWKRFIRPSELGQLCMRAGLMPVDMSGLVFNPLKNEFFLDPYDVDVNYFLVAEKA